MINLDSVPIQHPFVAWFAGLSIPLPGGRRAPEFGDRHAGLRSRSPIVIAHFTRFGADVYAIGGDRVSAALMGVPMRRTTVRSTRSAASTARSAASSTLSTPSSGYPLAGSGNELTAIASVVLGGTLLTGGVGMVAGTLFGGMILGLIATLINFNGSLNGAWIMIISGVLLFLFIVMQRSLLGSFRLRSVDLSRRISWRGHHRLDKPRTSRRLRPQRAGAPSGPRPRGKAFERNLLRQLAGRLGRESSAASIRRARCCRTPPICARASRSPAPL